MTAANHTPTSILALAREANQACPDCGVQGCPDNHAVLEPFWDAVTPALIVALVERLRDAAGRSPSFEEYAMTTPLLPVPELEKQQ